MGRVTLMFKFDDAIRGGVFHPVGEDNAAVGRGVPPELSAHAQAVENIVPEDEADGLVSDVFFPKNERLSNTCW